MTRAREAAAWATALAVVALAAVVLALVAFMTDWVVLDRRRAGLDRQFFAVAAGAAHALLVIAGATILRHRPRNRLGWVLLLGASAGALAQVADAYVWFGQVGDRYGVVYRSALDLPGRAYAGWFYGWGSDLFVVVGIAALLLVYPDGRLPSRRWRPVAAALIVVGGIRVVSTALAPGPVRSSVEATPNPFGQPWLRFLGYRVQVFDDDLTILAVTFALVFVAVALAPLTRLRRVDRRHRAPMRAFVVCATALGVIAAFGVARFAAGLSERNRTIESIIQIVAMVGIAIAIVDAVFRHHLDEIEVAIRRTVVFGGLSLFVAAVYAATSAGIGSAAAAAGAGWVVPLTATSLAAIGLQPIRFKVDAMAQRMVFGPRPTAPEVLGHLARRLAGETEVERALPQLAATLAEAFAAEFVVVEASDRLATVGLDISAPEIVVDVVYGTTPSGRLVLRRTPREPWTDADRSFLALIATHVAPAFNTIKVDAELRHRAEEAEQKAEMLRRSQQRLASAQFAARARFAQEVHERVWPLLDAVEDALALDDTLGAKGAADRALAEVRRIGHGLDPSELRDLGAVAALAAEARDLGVPLELSVRAELADRLDETTERTMFLALVAVIRGAGRAPVGVTIDTRGDQVAFSAVGGRPLPELVRAELEDRMAAVGGELTAADEELTGTIPIPAVL